MASNMLRYKRSHFCVVKLQVILIVFFSKHSLMTGRSCVLQRGGEMNVEWGSAYRVRKDLHGYCYRQKIKTVLPMILVQNGQFLLSVNTHTMQNHSDYHNLRFRITSYRFTQLEIKNTDIHLISIFEFSCNVGLFYWFV